jgi:hypothetical protein
MAVQWSVRGSELGWDRNERWVVNKPAALFFWSAFSLSAQITLGPTVSTFGVLGGSTVTNTGSSLVAGNLGVSPGTAITGFPPGLVGGTIHSADATAALAQSDLTTTYNSAAGATCPPGNVLTGTDLGGLTLTAGVYCFATSAQLTGTLTLNAQGNQNGQFIFQIGTALTTATSSTVVLINLAQASNVFWQMGTSATLGTTSSFAGNIMALASISMGNGVSLSGRALARNGAVTLIGDTIGGIAGLTGAVGIPATPAPSSLILVAAGLICAVIYQARARRSTVLRRD